MAKGPGLGAGVLFWASLIEVGLLLIGDDGPDVADEESRGPRAKADTPGEGFWEGWVPLVLLLSACSAPEHHQGWRLESVSGLLWSLPEWQVWWLHT